MLGHIPPPNDPVPNSLPRSRDNVPYLCPFKSSNLLLGSQDPQGGGQVRHVHPWDPTSCRPAQSHSAAFTDLCIQLCSPVVILDPTEQVSDTKPQVTLSHLGVRPPHLHLTTDLGISAPDQPLRP